MNARSLLPLALLALAAQAVSQDPPAPPGGFEIVSVKDKPVTWSDGYKSCMDLYFPKRAAPTTGWPVVAVIHGKSKSKAAAASMAMHLAKYGYATYAYDWRGEGCTKGLNKSWPGTYTWDRVITDAAESYGIASGFVPRVMDPKRLAMSGVSGGGVHCWDAAANSGRALKVKGAVSQYPRITAVAPEINALVSTENQLPDQGTILRSRFARTISENRLSRRWLLAKSGNYDQLYKLVIAQGGADRLPMVKSNDVAILCRMCWDDFLMHIANSFDDLQQLKPGVPFKGHINGQGHGSPAKNTIGKAAWRDEVRRWFDRFMKGVKSGITKEPAFEAAVVPLDSRYTKTDSQWQYRFSSVWPPKTPTERSYMRADMSLSKTAPRGAETGPILKHRVASGYGLKDFVDRDHSGETGVGVGRALKSIPLISHAFVGPVLQNEVELFGRPTVEFAVKASKGDFQISAALLARDASNRERYIVGATSGVRGKSAGVHKLKFALRDTATIIPKGARLVLRIENHGLIRTPAQRVIEYVPWFHDVDLQLQISAATAATLDLPVAVRGVGVTPRYQEVSGANGIDHAINVDLGADQAGRPYLLYVTGSGFGPGLDLGGTWMPLNVDQWTIVGIALMNTPSFHGFANIADTNGRGTAKFRLPSVVSKTLAGTRLGFAALAFPALGTWRAGGPSELVILE